MHVPIYDVRTMHADDLRKRHADNRGTNSMINHSSFFIHGCRRGEDMVAGPSGHTQALTRFMRIFKNFDVCKWTLICVVWLVGADHHTVYEVLVAAARHGLPYNPENNSVEFTHTLLRTVVAARRKPAWGLDVAK